MDQITQYYRDQLARIGKPKTEYAPTFQIRHTSGSTKWLNLNDESATELVKWLQTNYKIGGNEALILIAKRTRTLLQRDAEGLIEDFETEFKNLAGAIIETAENAEAINAISIEMNKFLKDIMFYLPKVKSN